MTKLLSSESLWKPGGDYYTERPEELRLRPRLLDMRLLRERRTLDLFSQYGELSSSSRVLEIGCGQSMWLPCLAGRFGCEVKGLDIEPYAAELARANLAGAGHYGEIFCRDAFDVNQNEDLLDRFDLIYSMGVMEHFADAAERLAILSRYLKKNGRLLTMVPNLQGVNWLLQRIASLERLHMHVVYDVQRLVEIHQCAGLAIRVAGYTGFHDGFVSGCDRKTPRWQRALHQRLCWLVNMAGTAWVRVWQECHTPELAWLSPHVYCVAVRTH